MVELSRINKKFNGRDILKDFDLQIGTGEFVSIMGSSGAGKTTILNIIGLLLKPDGGDVMIKNIVNPNSKETMNLRRGSFGYIFQNYVLMDNETVEENLKLSKKHNPDYTPDLVNEILELVQLDSSFLKKKVFQLSGGEQQRIAIARAMLKRCDIILADEPTGNLDKKNKAIIVDLFKQLKRMGKTIVCVTHDPDVAQSSDRIVEI